MPVSNQVVWNERTDRPGGLALVVIIAAVVAFRVAAWLVPSSFIDIPDVLRLPIGVLGLVFLACSVWAWRASRSTITRVFLAHGVGGAIHWGGTIGSSSEGMAIAWLFFYLAATLMGDGALFDLSLRYPRRQPARGLPGWVPYVPAILAALALLAAPFAPKAMAEGVLGLLFMAGMLLSIAAGVGFIVQWIRAGSNRGRYGLTPILASLIMTTGLDVMADSAVLPGNPEAWNLTYGLVPLVLAWALVRSARGSKSGLQALRPEAVHGPDEKS